MGDVSQKCIKWLMFGFNLLFWITGVTLIIAGAVAQSHSKEYSRFYEGVTVSAPVLLIIVGVFISIIAFLGCCGAARDNYSMLMGFAVIVSIIFIVQVAGGIAGYVQKGKVTTAINEIFPSLMKDNNSLSAIDDIQKGLGCCGSQGYNEWFNITRVHSFNGTENASVVPSCCQKSDNCKAEDLLEDKINSECAAGVKDHSKCIIYTDGCVPKIQNLVQRAINGLAGAAIGLAFIQLLGIGFACYLAKRIRSGYVYA
ncbi:putative CD63 antigen [Hypsibius exemplaris]|uniref:Tetraspanin n=1 Tax=Hypsibius exemplaris TaxID=2072580 RepID=A0A1W0XEM5_HYPEX|nr:putative CD63 antigen [Hypsibius exemplaris]